MKRRAVGPPQLRPQAASFTPRHCSGQDTDGCLHPHPGDDRPARTFGLFRTKAGGLK